MLRLSLPRLRQLLCKIDTLHYDITQGSTIITFTEAYLKTLGNGTHWYTAEFSDGTSENIRLDVNVAAAPAPAPNDPSTNVPVTGDSSNMLAWWVALICAALGMLCLIVWKKRQQMTIGKGESF